MVVVIIVSPRYIVRDQVPAVVRLVLGGLERGWGERGGIDRGGGEATGMVDLWDAVWGEVGRGVGGEL